MRSLGIDRFQVGLIGSFNAAGASIDLQDIRGYAPLHAAAQHGRLEVARALLDAGASYSCTVRKGFLRHLAIRITWCTMS